LVAVFSLCLLSGLEAQTPTIKVGGRAQIHYRAASGDSSANFPGSGVRNGFEVRRLRMQADVRFADNVSLVIQPSFEMGSLRMRDAFVRVGVVPRIGVTLGQEKSPFQRYELTSSNNLLSIERGVRILGLSGREALNNLLEANGYIGHDLGAFVDFTGRDGRIAVKAGVSNGSRESVTDVNNAKSIFGRAAITVTTNASDQPMLQVGASFAARDRAICQTVAGTSGCGAYFADSSATTTAFGLDLEWGGFRPGLHVIADFATGDNVPAALRITSGRNSANVRNSADSNMVTFMGLHVVAAYRRNTAGSDARLIKVIEPALRVDYTDPNTDADDDDGILITPAVSLYFANTVVLRAGLDFYSYTDAAGIGRSASEFKISWQANF
jgi:hypothetical protein